jgi:DNA-directed RNA polymerase subunit RPC12/RpoP
MEAPFVCPYCDTQIQLPEDAWYYTCPHCGSRLDLKSQFAYLRGLDAFSEGQEIMLKISPRKRRTPFYPKITEAMQLFMEAYSSLQVAFLAELAEPQRSLAVEMMASMANEFMKREMVSPFEESYWNTLMVEQTAQIEYDRLKQKLAAPAGVFGAVKQLRWRTRQKQLVQSLVQLNKKVKILEDRIGFVDIPRARNRKWKP